MLSNIPFFPKFFTNILSLAFLRRLSLNKSIFLNRSNSARKSDLDRLVYSHHFCNHSSCSFYSCFRLKPICAESVVFVALYTFFISMFFRRE
ncbi:hypothetical protein MtrunA17_Chr4g0057781 [Medicago truncatula]|uniref:Transmembrane protein n=1 Tax=Medicago truncatula TaxID=3880 RepID=A0A396ICV2_MEDTR|nr:hypothetical protein MtrunA17_Chr4g0057781 [Medicago truncatula]